MHVLQVILAKALTDKQLEKKKLEAEEGGDGETKDESQDVKSGSLYRSQQEKVFNIPLTLSLI